MSTPIPVSQFMPEEVSNEALRKIADLANQQYKMEKAIEEAEELVKYEKEKLRVLSQVTIPQAMAAVGLAEIKSKDGSFVLVIKPFYSAKIDEKNVQAAHKWLIDNGHGALIKHDITCTFDKDCVEEVANLKSLLETGGYAFLDEEKVHNKTLTAFVKEQVEAGTPFPLETFNGYVGSKAVIKKG